MNTTARSLLVVLLVGCGTPAIAPTDGGSDAASIGDAGGTDAVVVHVFDVDHTSIAGAVVALDLPSGARVELTSGADGIVRFEGLRFDAGMFDVVVWAPDHDVFAHVAMTGADYATRTTAGELQIGLRHLTNARVALTGNVTGVAPTEYLAVTTDTTPLFYEMAGPAYATEIAANMPFHVIAASLSSGSSTGRDYTNTFHHWAVSPMHAASATAVTLDIDLTASAVTPLITTGTFTIPAHATGSFFDTATPTVGIYDDVARMGAIGLASSIAVAADGLSVDYTAEYVLPPGVVRPSTNFGMVGAGTYSSASLVGMPIDGAQTFALLDPPSIVATAGAIPHALDEVAIRNPVAAALLQLVVTSDDSARIVVVGPVGARGLRVPAFPTGADRAVLLDGSLGRRVSLCVLEGTGLDDLCTLTSVVADIADP